MRFGSNIFSHKEGKRRDNHDNQRNPHIDREHKNQRTQNCQYARKELREAHQQAFGKLVGICDNTADNIAIRMGIDIFQREILNFAESIGSNIADYVISDLVVADIHNPLSNGSSCNHKNALEQNREDALKIDSAGGHDAVDGLSNQNRQIQREYHSESGQKNGENQQSEITTNIMQNFADGRVFRLFR